MRLKPPRRLSHGEEATLGEHLEELRGRLIVCFVALGLTSIVAFIFHHRLVTWLIEPLPPEHRKLLTLGVAEPFTTSMKVSFYVALALALPVLLWELWAFLAPALYKHEKRVVLPVIFGAVLLFVSGVSLSFYVVLPLAIGWLMGIAQKTDALEPMITYPVRRFRRSFAVERTRSRTRARMKIGSSKTMPIAKSSNVANVR